MTTFDDILRRQTNAASQFGFPAAPAAPAPAPAAPSTSTSALSATPAPTPAPIALGAASGAVSLGNSRDDTPPINCGKDRHWNDEQERCVDDTVEDPALCPDGMYLTPQGNCVFNNPSGTPTENNCGTANCIPPMVCVQREWGPNCENPDTGGSGGGGGHPPPSPGGGGGGSRSSSPTTFRYSTGANDFDATLQGMLREMLNSPSRFTPQALQALYGAIARQRSNSITSGERGVRDNAAQRGMSRAGSVQAALRGVQAGADSQRGQAIVGVQVAKINADYQDKVGALDRAQRYLDSLRDSEYRLMVATEQRSQFDANLALAYANLSEQRVRLQMALQSEWDKLNALAGYGLLNSGV